MLLDNPRVIRATFPPPPPPPPPRQPPEQGLNDLLSSKKKNCFRLMIKRRGEFRLKQYHFSQLLTVKKNHFTLSCPSEIPSCARNVTFMSYISLDVSVCSFLFSPQNSNKHCREKAVLLSADQVVYPKINFLGCKIIISRKVW